MRAILISLLLFCAVPAAPAAARETPAAQYRLDDANGTSFALYPGIAYRSNVDPKDAVTSLEDLEGRVGALPEGAKITWTPARWSKAGKPLLFGQEKTSDDFGAFCAGHHIALEIPQLLAKPPEP